MENHTKSKDKAAEKPTDMGNNTCTANHTAKQSRKKKMLANPEIKK